MDIAIGAAQSFIEGEFGGPTEDLEGEVSILTTVTKIVSNDPDALSLTMINLGSFDVYLMFDDQVSITRGIFLPAGGGSVSMNVRDDQALPTRNWYGVGNGGASTLFYIRTRRYTLTATPTRKQANDRAISEGELAPPPEPVHIGGLSR